MGKPRLPLYSIKLSHQGILLVSIPLICQIAFILTLTTLLGQVEREAYKAERSRNILVSADRLVSLFYQAGTALASYDVSKNPIFKLSYETYADRAVSQLMVLQRLAEGDPETEKSMDAIQLSTAKMLNTFTLAEYHIDRGQKPLEDEGVSRIQAMQNAGDGFDKKLAELMASQQAINAAEPETELKLRSQIEYCLLAGVLLNIVLAFALARGFYKATASRLSILMQNTERLARHQELHPPISGVDEIAELDSFFRQMAAALEDAAKHKQQFLQMVSHDLRSPLTAAQLSLSLLAGGSKGDLPPGASADMLSIQNSLSRLVHLINDLLDIEKLEAGHMELRIRATNLEVILENSIETVRALAEAKDVRIDIDGNCDIDIQVDGERISQVIINLLSNAIKVSPKQSQITISAHVASQDSDNIQLVQINIQDQGPGIDPSLQRVIFDRFQQAPDAKGGSGLGLAICKAIVEQHGGQIGVTSTPPDGATFWINLPTAATSCASDETQSAITL